MTMHDSVASFYGGYDQVRFSRSEMLPLPRRFLVIGVAATMLLVAVAADVSALSAGSTVVKVTEVDWSVEGYALATAAGFTMHASNTVTVSLTCTSLCFRVVGVFVASPFEQVSASIVYAPIQYVNVTVVAPSSAYAGPLSISLQIP